jgi:hypothetical protein
MTKFETPQVWMLGTLLPATLAWIGFGLAVVLAVGLVVDLVADRRGRREVRRHLRALDTYLPNRAA